MPPIPHTPASSKKNPANHFLLWHNSVLPQVALWGKGKMCPKTCVFVNNSTKILFSAFFQKNSAVVFLLRILEKNC
jgi:hypothetical protein